MMEMLEPFLGFGAVVAVIGATIWCIFHGGSDEE